MIDIRETERGIILQVHVVPRSAKCEVAGVQGDALKLKLTAAPVEGQANAECIRFLSDILGIKKKQVKILGGHKSKKKSVSIEGIGRKDIETLIS
ncbi:MAG TPA: DUF167 domain-containing protein [Syntrophales bacterium]|nr:DUF167 domain-containing protein [Syntrophales bacterium]